MPTMYDNNDKIIMTVLSSAVEDRSQGCVIRWMDSYIRGKTAVNTLYFCLRLRDLISEGANPIGTALIRA
jgi:hypothetical protein